VGQGVQLSAAVIPNDAIQDVVWEISPGSDGDNVSWNPQTRTITGLSVSSVPGTRWGIRAKSMDGLNTYSNWCWVQVLAPPPTAKPTATPTKKPTVTIAPSPTATASPGGLPPIVHQGVYRIKNASTGVCLAVKGNNWLNKTYDPTVRVEGAESGKRNQMWRLEYVASGSNAGCYRLWANELSMYDPYIYQGTNIATNFGQTGRRIMGAFSDSEVSLSENNDNANLYFDLVRVPGSSNYYIKTKASNYSKTLACIGSAVIQSTYTGAVIQQWELDLVGYGNFSTEITATKELPRTHLDKIISEEKYDSAEIWERVLFELPLTNAYAATIATVEYYRATDYRPIACENIWWYLALPLDPVGYEMVKATKPTMRIADLALVPINSQASPLEYEYNKEQARLTTAAQHLRKTGQTVYLANINENNYEMDDNQDDWYAAVGNYRTFIRGKINADGTVGWDWNFRDFYDWDPNIFSVTIPGVQTNIFYAYHYFGIGFTKHYDIADRLNHGY